MGWVQFYTCLMGNTLVISWRSFSNLACFQLESARETKCILSYQVALILVSVCALSLAVDMLINLHSYLMYISTISSGESSRLVSSSAHSLSSTSSVVDCWSCVQNHGGLLKEQQVLVGPHP